MILDIAVGKSRRQKTWQNKKMPWAELVKKLEETTRTSETYSVYMNSSLEFQAEKKDVGGFVGGYLTGGKRTPVTNVAHRQLITLDIDFGHPEVWDDFTMVYGVEAVVYSTHKHNPENPRLRLLIPLHRPVDREEYEAISRKVADTIGIQLFDSTTFQPQRLMYWPSTSSDGEYYYKYQESGVWLNADDILNSYTNWKDMSEWPMTDTEDISVHSDFKKIGEPTEKPGLIGAFCRAYDILDAREEFLNDIYAAAENGERMTFTGGTTAQGVVVYGNGSFAYSHHSSDPAHGKLLNSFDLVRIHKFGYLDKDSDAAINKLESFKQMSAYAANLDAVKKEITLGAFEVFSEDYQQDAEEAEEDWKIKLKFNSKGVIDPTIDNIVVIIENDSELKRKIKYNEFEGNVFLLQDVPWCKVSKPRPFVDADDAAIRHYVEKVYGVFNTGKTFDAINIAAHHNRYHPIRNYINAQQWDGIPRIDSLLIKYLNAEDSPYVRAVTKKTLVAAVARVFIPGIKFDTVLTLVGQQGIRKSTFIDFLGLEWFSDSFSSVQGKESYEQLQGSWLIEIPELAGFKKAEVETVKHFVAKKADKFRVAYGRRTENFPRQCIFIGTTNEISFLKDYTGNRRFWPVTVLGETDHVLEEMPIDQIWAEAKHCFDNRETIYLSKELEAEAKQIQLNHTEAEERTGVVEKFLDMKLPVDWNKMSLILRRGYIKNSDDINEFGSEERVSVCVAEIWSEVFDQDFSKMTSVNTKYIHQMLSSIPGWVKSNSTRSFGIYGRQRAYIKVESFATTNKKVKNY